MDDILLRQIPDQSAHIKAKDGYRGYAIWTEGEHYHEPLVDIGLYGIAGQNYYSRPNKVTGEPIAGVDPTIRLRRSIARRLATINHELQTSEAVKRIFGKPVELYIEEGMRSMAMQKHLYEEIFPRFIRARHPKMAEDQVQAERDRLIAMPIYSVSSPPPHNTGAAVSLCLRYTHPDLGYVPRSLVPMGRGQGDAEIAHPDYFEHKTSLSALQQQYRRNRRVFYWVMRGALLGDDSGFIVNPEEWWHWSYGDQMWAALTKAPYAFFDGLEPPFTSA